MEVVVALLMFVNFEIKEQRIQHNMATCLRGKREAERTYSANVSSNSNQPQAEIDSNLECYINIKKLIIDK